MNHSPFIIRVYGIYIHPEHGVFVSDEIVKGKKVTKFPGGGLEYGEGTIDCLKREMVEETGTHFEIISHFYTTDFFIESAFHPGCQLISIYYLMKPIDQLNIKIPMATGTKKVFDFEKEEEGAQSFRYIPKNTINPEQFTFPVDRHVANLLQNF